MSILLDVRKTIRLHRVQSEFCKSQALLRGFVGGRGSGKSTAGAIDLIRRAKRGVTYLVACPTYPMLQDSSVRTFLKVAQEMGVLLPGDFKRTPPPAARLTTGAEILFRSTDDPDRLRGPSLGGVWLDEASLMKRDAFEIVLGCLRQEGQIGWLSATFTPRGLTHWTYEQWGQEKPDTAIFHARTKDNPFAPKGFHATLAQQYSGLRAQQELEGRFVQVEGAEWPQEYFPESIWFNDWPAELSLKVMALDPSKGKSDKTGDYSAFVLVGLDKHGILWIDADLNNTRPTTRIVEDGIRLFREFAPQAFAIEINAFQELLAKEFIEQGRKQQIALPIWGINNHVNKEVRIRTLGPYLARGEMRFKAKSPGARMLVDQLRDFPEGKNDDACDSLEMCLRMLWHLLGTPKSPGQPEIVRA